LILIALFILRGCAFTKDDSNFTLETTGATSIQKTSQPIPTKILGTPISPKTTPSATILPTPTVQSQATTSDLLATEAITPKATLSIEQEQIILTELMLNEGDCKLPCWWEVTPGQTTVQVASERFTSQGIPWNEGDVVLGNFPRAGVRSQFIVDGDIVQQIVTTGTRDHYDLANRFTEIWQHYTIENMLEQYGMPSHVFISPPVFVEVGTPNNYDLLLYFMSSDALMNFSITADYLEEEEKDRICADFENVQSIYLKL